MKKFFISLCVVAMAVLSVGCGQNVRYGDASQDEGSREWGPKEIKDTVAVMTESLYVFLKQEYKRPAYLELKRVQNRTSEHIDSRILTNELQTNLIKKRIRFIDRSMTEDAIKEMELGMTGMIDPDSAVPMGNLKSPNFYLAGDISDNVRRVGSNNVQYLVVTLKLVELSTGITMWQDQKEFLKTSSANRITF